MTLEDAKNLKDLLKEKKDDIDIEDDILSIVEDLSLSKLNLDNEKEKVDKIIVSSMTKAKVNTKKARVNDKIDKRFFYRRVLPVMITLPIAISMLFATLKDISDGGTLNEAISIVTMDAEENLEDAGIITIYDNGKVKINGTLTEEDYQNNIEIKDPSLAEAYAYKKVFEKAKANNLENDALAKTMTYDDGNERYDSWDDFLIQNDMIDKDGNPSDKRFDEESKKELKEAFNNNQIDNIVKSTSKVKDK